MGAGWLGLGELTRAHDELEECLSLMRVNGERALEVSPLCALSTLALWQGVDADALALALGRHAAAADAFAAAQACASAISSPYGYDASAGLARVALAQGDLGAAMEALEPLLRRGGATTSDDDNPLKAVDFPAS